MDKSIISSVYLVPEWITRLIEDYEEELEASWSWSMKLLEEEGRKAMWNMCNMLGVDINGVPGQACRLLERYLSTYMHEFLQLRAIDIEEWDDFKRSLATRIPLLMASCVQLAAKMSSVALQVNASTIRTCLLCKGVVFSVAEIIEAEFQVFSTLGFRVPLWTSLEAAQMLAVEVCLPAAALDGVALMVDIAEYRRNRLAASVRSIALASPSPTFKGRLLGTVHLAAGAVAASARHLAGDAPDPVPRLALLTRAPHPYIKCVCDVILAELLADNAALSPRTVITKKRKRNP